MYACAMYTPYNSHSSAQFRANRDPTGMLILQSPCNCSLSAYLPKYSHRSRSDAHCFRSNASWSGPSPTWKPSPLCSSMPGSKYEV